VNGPRLFLKIIDCPYIDVRVIEEDGIQKIQNLAKMKKVQMYAFHRRNQG
jgi:hypothetical protein